MDFKLFAEHKQRMCNKYSRQDCQGCPLVEFKRNKLLSCNSSCLIYPLESEKIVSEWAAEHPIQTNNNKFKEVFGYEAWRIVNDAMDILYKCQPFFLAKNDDPTVEITNKFSKWLSKEYIPKKE